MGPSPPPAGDHRRPRPVAAAAPAQLDSGRAVWLGRLHYDPALALQLATARRVAAGEAPDTLLLLEHPPTYTLGLRGEIRHLLVTEDQLRRLGATLHRVDRGGDITFHGPGQLVGYPIIDLKRRPGGPIGYLRRLEKCLIAALAGFGIEAEHEHGFTGVWVDRAKIAAIGVRLDAAGITQHGFALNVHTDLGWFDHIVPCGLAGKSVTSLETILGRRVPLIEVARRVAAAFGDLFGLRLDWTTEAAEGDADSPETSDFTGLTPAAAETLEDRS